jgi:hypothetical protein
MILEDGSEWPLGVFMFPSKEVNKRSVGNFLSSTLFDETFILDQGTSEPFGLNDTTVITDAMWRLIIDSKIGNFNIIDSQTKAKEPIAWPPGTSRLRILAELCEMTSYLSPFIDNDGVLQCVPDNPGRPADHAYTTSGGYARIIADSIVDSSSLLEAPNVYIVVNSGATESEISGRYDIPDLWPHSKLNRGFEVVKTITMQGIESSDKATQIAQTTARHDLGTFKSVSFSSAPDPRHDTFDVVEFDEEFYTEASWSMSLTPGAEMSHDLVGIVS